MRYQRLGANYRYCPLESGYEKDLSNALFPARVDGHSLSKSRSRLSLFDDQRRMPLVDADRTSILLKLLGGWELRSNMRRQRTNLTSCSTSRPKGFCPLTALLLKLQKRLLRKALRPISIFPALNRTFSWKSQAQRPKRRRQLLKRQRNAPTNRSVLRMRRENSAKWKEERSALLTEETTRAADAVPTAFVEIPFS